MPYFRGRASGLAPPEDLPEDAAQPAGAAARLAQARGLFIRCLFGTHRNVMAVEAPVGRHRSIGSFAEGLQ